MRKIYDFEVDCNEFLICNDKGPRALRYPCNNLMKASSNLMLMRALLATQDTHVLEA